MKEFLTKAGWGVKERLINDLQLGDDLNVLVSPRKHLIETAFTEFSGSSKRFGLAQRKIGQIYRHGAEHIEP